MLAGPHMTDQGVDQYVSYFLGAGVDDITAAKRVAEMTDEQLLYSFDRLHSPSLIATHWIERLQSEVLRRGLRKVS